MKKEYETYWAMEGIRLLICEDGVNRVPTVNERIEHAFNAGWEARGREWDLPPGCHAAAIEIDEEERE